MTQQVEVSIIIPTRNRPLMLRRSVGSALRQIGVALEVVVVIDGKDDVSEAVLADFQDTRLRWVHLEQPVGGGEARNVGARAAFGYYVALLDDDDEWHPKKLQKQILMANTATTDTYVVTTQYLYRRAGSPDEVWPGHLPGKNEELSEFLFSSAGGFQTSTYLCPRELLLRIPFNPSLKRHQDWDWFLRLIQEPGFQLHVVREPLSIYWAPTGRKSISGEPDWKYSLQWLETSRRRITAKAYASFVVRICLRGAMLGKASAGEVSTLLWRLLTCEGMTLKLGVHVIVALMISEATRGKIRGWRNGFISRDRTLQMMEEARW